MENKRPAVHSYNPAQLAVLPGTFVRGLILGFVYLPLFPLLYLAVQEALSGTGAGAAMKDVQQSMGWGGLAGLGFVFPIAFSLFLAWLGYRRRSYEIGPEGVTERRGIVFRSKQHLGYDEFEGVTVTESFLQSLYGAGTVLLTDINQADDEQVVLKMSYVRNPEDVSTTILRQITDIAETDTGNVDAHNVEELDVESESISRFSSDNLAAGTGFEYMMPSAILHPRPWEAAKYGVELGLTYSTLGAAIVLYYLQDLAMSLLGVPSVFHLAGITLLSAVVFSLLMGGWLYSVHDDVQYELYEDHIKLIRGDQTTSFSLDDIDATTMEVPGLTDLQRPWSDVHHIALLDEAGDEVVVFKFIANSEAVYDEINNWLFTGTVDEPSIQSRDDEK